MTKIDVKLSDMGEGYGVFHDLRYANDCEGGNQNGTTFEIVNQSGNTLEVDFGFYEQDQKTNKWEWTWRPLKDIDGIKIRITGSIENSEFLQMLQLILETEKMVEIIKP